MDNIVLIAGRGPFGSPTSYVSIKRALNSERRTQKARAAIRRSRARRKAMAVEIEGRGSPELQSRSLWGFFPAPSWSTLLVFLLLVHSAQAISPAGVAAGYSVAGRIKLDGLNSKGSGLHTKVSNVKIILNGGQRVTFARHNGYFTFHNVPAGTHLIEVSAMGFLFSPVRVDISARNPGKIQAALTENRRSLSEMILEPMRVEQYYEVREPFSILSLVKSPMGLMVGFMVIVVFVMPKLMENMDPEEIRRAQEEMRSQGVPSLSSLLPGQT